MRTMISKVTRTIEFKICKKLSSSWRVFLLKVKHPYISIKNTTIGRNCDIYCMPGSVMEITNSSIGAGSRIRCGYGGHLKLTGVHVGRNSEIITREKIIIEEGCQIAEMVVIRDQDHIYENKELPILEQGYQTAPIHIGKHVWLGAKATVLKGTTIGDRTVIGAHSLAKGELESNSVYVGSPVKKIKSF